MGKCRNFLNLFASRAYFTLKIKNFSLIWSPKFCSNFCAKNLVIFWLCQRWTLKNLKQSNLILIHCLMLFKLRNHKIAKFFDFLMPIEALAAAAAAASFFSCRRRSQKTLTDSIGSTSSISPSPGFLLHIAITRKATLWKDSSASIQFILSLINVRIFCFNAVGKKDRAKKKQLFHYRIHLSEHSLLTKSVKFNYVSLIFLKNPRLYWISKWVKLILLIFSF